MNPKKRKKKAPAKPVKVNQPWAKEQIRILKRLYRSNSNASIAKVVGHTVASVVNKAHRLGLHKGVRRLRKMGKENIKYRWGE